MRYKYHSFLKYHYLEYHHNSKLLLLLQINYHVGYQSQIIYIKNAYPEELNLSKIESILELFLIILLLIYVFI